ncbi:hypothetical protein [Hymenobacter negativus]|uniref:hypothetical protein n=1 Tax=Hymenobacter negativus TaxID=2795026 RepID=UPI001AAEAA06|nr:hypothetical protein [Hymenobacter negativus]
MKSLVLSAGLAVPGAGLCMLAQATNARINALADSSFITPHNCLITLFFTIQTYKP